MKTYVEIVVNNLVIFSIHFCIIILKYFYNEYTVGKIIIFTPHFVSPLTKLSKRDKFKEL